MNRAGPSPRRRMCIVATIPTPLNVFMGPHILELSKRFDITLMADGVATEVADLLSEHVRFRPLAISRRIAPLADLAALFELWWLFRRERFDVVHSMMPKSGLLAMLAGALAGLRVRVHWFTGQVWATKRGIERRLLKSMDQLLVACATHLLVDSESQREFLTAQGVVRPDQAIVLCHGSVCGVDAKRFCPNPAARAQIRARMGIPDSSVVALYLGRLNREKGVLELADAFLNASAACPELHLLLVGPDEAGLRAVVAQKLTRVASRGHFVDFTKQPEDFMAAADFFVLPSHREGFGSSVIEAAACGVPAIGTRIYGLTDAIVEGATGLLVPSGDGPALVEAIIRLTKEGTLRLRLGKGALERVKDEFRQEHLVSALGEFYDGLCA
jgi:glycosyltransferase involved in cell wall biosynthesis